MCTKLSKPCPPFSRQLGRGLLSVALLWGGWVAQAPAQPIGFDADPAHMARLAMGDERGTVAVGVWRNGQARYAYLHNKGQGLTEQPTPTKHALFEIGSVTKVFTGLLLAQAVEQGSLSLDDSLGKLLKDTTPIDSPWVAAITLRQLVTHTACLPRAPQGVQESLSADNPYADFSRQDLWHTLATLTVPSAPPCPASYSNLGLGLLGELLAQHHGEPWHALVRQRITTPLGMPDTVQHLKSPAGDKTARLTPGLNNRAPRPPWDFQALAGAGALRSTVADMLLFSRALLAGRQGPLGPASERLLTPLGEFQGNPIAYAAFVRGPDHRRLYFHDGLTGGYRTLWMLAPDTQEAVVVMAGNSHAPVNRLQALLAAHRYPPTARANAPAPPGAQTPVASLTPYTGVYRVGPATTVAVVAQDGQLYRRITGGGLRPWSPAGPDTFVDADLGMQCVFQRGQAPEAASPPGPVVGLACTQGGGQLTAVRTDEPVPALSVIPAADRVAREKDYMGRYRLARVWRRDLDFDVKAEGGQLLVRSGNFPRLPAFPVPGQPDRFFYEAVKAELLFERDATGQVVSLTLFEGGTMRMTKVSE